MEILIVDDNEPIVKLLTAVLEKAGHKISSCHRAEEAVAIAPKLRPDCILLDLILPDKDGLEVCQTFRYMPELADTKIIIISGKSYDFDKRKAKEFGADGYMVKPVDIKAIVPYIEKVTSSQIVLTYWGTRGTLPVPGAGSLKYGGNTSCLSLAVEDEPLIIFDAGTGIRELSNHLLSNKTERLTAKLFISHPHWDHISGFPFFTPLYVQGNDIEILGPKHHGTTLREIMSAQMDGVYFPVTIREFAARAYFHDLREETVHIGRGQITSLSLNHPGNCLGYKAIFRDKTICYMTDNELYPSTNRLYNDEQFHRIQSFVQDCDILITDTTYLDDEYGQKTGWGHSCTREVVRLADAAKVKSLHLFHHDPSQSDSDIDKKLAEAKGHLDALNSEVECCCPHEGQHFVL